MMNVFEKIISQVEAELESSEKFMREYDDGIAQKAYYSGMAHILYIIQKEVKEHNNGWIPCSERLPEEPFGCLVTVIDCEPVTQNEFENILPYHVGYDGYVWIDADGEEIPFEVIAWQPLPKPYKESDTNGKN